MNDRADSQITLQWPPEPYKGLDYFTAADAPLFGQRDVEIDDMLTRLFNFDTRAVLLHGETGTGKSSFLRAGLCPRLQRLPVEETRKFFFLHETRPDDSTGDPLLIRATDDPVARIYDALRDGADAERSNFSDRVRASIREALSEPVPYDRHKAIGPILTALKALTAPPQAATFVLLVDQAEEVLTLPAVGEAANRRTAFFALIEKVCLRSFDLRLIVALRTEYYGRFCSFFRIRPTTAITPKSEVGAGLFDYLLRPLGKEGIVAAIRQPTLETSPDDRFPAPRSFYGFSYEGTLPETIASDLLRQSGEASTLPAMQIVCKQLYERVVQKDKRSEIIEQDYELSGRAEGAIDAYIVRALGDAADKAGLSPLRETDLDTWALVLWNVVGQAEGGTVQTLIASEHDLLKPAIDRGVPEERAREMLKQMTDPGRRLLRLASGEDGKPAYSLGHDSLGPSILKRSNEAAVRVEQEKKRADDRARVEREWAEERAKAEKERLAARAAAEREMAEERRRADRRLYKTRLRLGSIAFAMLALAAVVAFYMGTVVAPLREKVRILTNYAERDRSSDLRVRLLLLVAALRSGDRWPGSWFLDVEPSRKVLRDVLARSPVFGGAYGAAAWDSTGQYILYVTNQKTLVVHDLTAGKTIKSFDLPEPSREADGPRLSPIAPPPPFVGLIKKQNDTQAVMAFGFGANSAYLWVEEGSALREALRLPKSMQEPGEWIPRAEISGEHVRVIFLRWDQSVITQMLALELSGAVASDFKPQKKRLAWEPIAQQAFRQPVLAEDCESYAFLGKVDPSGEERYDAYAVYVGKIGEKAEISAPLTDPLTVGAVAFARGCSSVLVRDESTLRIVPLTKNNSPSQIRSVPLTELVDAARMIVPSVGQAQPMLAAAPLTGEDGWRVGWPTPSGLTIVDVPDSQNIPRNLFKKDPRYAESRNAQTLQMLTGVDSAYTTGSLSFSPDGSHVLMMQQQNYGGQVELRAFDLNLVERRKELEKLTTSDDLAKEGCRVAKIQDGTNWLRTSEKSAWLSDENAPGPCDGFK